MLDIVADRLAAMPDLDLLLPGGLYKHRASRSGPKVTPEAFGSPPGAVAAPGKVLVHCILIDDGQSSDLTGPPGAKVGNLTFRYRSLNNAAEEGKLQSAVIAIRSYLMPEGVPGVIGDARGVLDIRESPGVGLRADVIEAGVSIVVQRWIVTGIWS